MPAMRKEKKATSASMMIAVKKTFMDFSFAFVFVSEISVHECAETLGNQWFPVFGYFGGEGSGGVGYRWVSG
jgi:hypothetical protein